MYSLVPLSRACLSAALLLAVCTPLPASGAPSLAPTSDQSTVAKSVADLLAQGHYSRKKLDDEMSQKVLQLYLESLDYYRLFFLQSDVDEFTKKYGTSLDDSIQRGDLRPAFEIYDRFRKRVESRVAKIEKLINKPYTFDSSRTVEINRQKSPWPKSESEADALWRDRIEGDLLARKLRKGALLTPAKSVEKRYDQLLRNISEQNEQDVLRTFLTALAQAYDPHSEYLTPSDYENFDIQMSLSLEGVGAVLRSDEGYARVVEIVPGGPAAREGTLRENDRISAVAQADGEFEDVVDMKLDDVVRKIRGKRGTEVRLEVIPANASDPSKREVIAIVRDKVDLKDQAASAELIEVPGPNGKVQKVGWITLPSFYRDMRDDGSRGTSGKSTTEDVALLLRRLKKEGIEGLVIDLRKDGGGSLEEAINLTGLFITRGPVVQSKDPNGKVLVSSDVDSSVSYTGPMVVVMNRLSASASEIFAAALQDYGRAVVVGDERSFGKGTVQTMLDVGKFMPLYSLGGANAGRLKLTIQKFYRVKGGSTQLNGVESDIVLPSLTDNPEIGEGALRYPLPYDEVAPLRIDRFAEGSLFLDELRAMSELRVGQDPEFAYVKEEMDRLERRIAENRLSLNEQVRRTEMENDKKREELREAERKQRPPSSLKAYELKLEDLDKPTLAPVTNRKKKKPVVLPDEAVEVEEDADKPEVDPIRTEAVNILLDLVNLTRSAKTASVGSSSKGAN